MRTIGSDAHVIETERSWDFMEPGDVHHRPLLVSSPAQRGAAHWLVDGESWGVARLAALRVLRSSGKITERQYRKFADDNAAAFYGL